MDTKKNSTRWILTAAVIIAVILVTVGTVLALHQLTRGPSVIYQGKVMAVEYEVIGTHKDVKLTDLYLVLANQRKSLQMYLCGDQRKSLEDDRWIELELSDKDTVTGDAEKPCREVRSLKYIPKPAPATPAIRVRGQ